MKDQKGHPCSCCSMSRRSFLGAMAVGAAALGAGCSKLGSLSMCHETKPGDVVDLGSLRPKPSVKIRRVIIRRTPPYWLGWPGTSYDLEGENTRYYKAFSASAKRLGVDLQNDPVPIEKPEAFAEYYKKLVADKPDAVLVHVQHLDTMRWLRDIAKAGIPTIVFAPIGTAFTQHVTPIGDATGMHVISSLEASAVEQAMRMVRAKRQLEATSLLVVQGTERKEEALERLGVKIKCVPRASMEEMFAQVPVTDEAREVARRRFRGAEKVVEPSKEDGLNAARSYIAAKQLLKQEGCNAITSDCLGMVTQKKVPTPPCMGASIFQDEGVTYGCEADVNGAVSLMLSSYLLDKPGFMNDPVPETVKNVLIAAHCVSGTRLHDIHNDDHAPYILRSHSESGIGVSPQVIWPVGKPVTLVQFQGPNSLILDTGTVTGNVNTPPAGGCRTSVEIAMDDVEDARDVMGFHQVVFYGNHRRDVEAFCQMYGIKVVHSPKLHEQTVAAAKASA